MFELFHRKPAATPAELGLRAERLLAEVEWELASNPRKAFRLLKNRDPRLDGQLAVGAPLFPRFADAVLRAGAQVGPQGSDLTARSLPAVTVQELASASFGLGLLRQGSQRGGVLYCRLMDEWEDYGGLDALVEVEALAALARDERVLFVLHAPARLLLRCDAVPWLLQRLPEVGEDATLDLFLEELLRFAEGEDGVSWDETVKTPFGWALSICRRL